MLSGFFYAISPYITPIIWALAVWNLIVFFIACSKTKKLESLVHPWMHYGCHREGSTDVNILTNAADSAAFWYSLYANQTAIFPLLGIFGTVCSLMGVSQNADTAASFFNALDTTIWGLIFAIVFKVIDSWISSTLDRALDESDHRIHKLTEERENYAQAEAGYHN